MRRILRYVAVVATLLVLPTLFAFAPRLVDRTLTIMSITPASGVPITVWTADLGGFKNGTTTFTRTYADGAVMKMTAPATAGDRVFSHWEADEAIYATSRTITVRMLTDRTLSAVYVPKFTLSVASFNPTSNVPITVYQADLNNLKNGTTLFQRTYKQGTTVGLTAPAIVEGTKYFERWNKNGAAYATTRTTSVQMLANTTMSAFYVNGALLTVSSQTPDTGVAITVYQADKAGLKNGNTTFTRLYAVGTNVSLTAPATAGGNRFVRWEKDGTPAATTRTISVLMGGAHTLKAVYAP